MMNTHHSGVVCLDDENGLSAMVQSELESMILNKERYDIDYPDHKKEILPGELWEIARNKVIHEMCIPPSTTDE